MSSTLHVRECVPLDYLTSTLVPFETLGGKSPGCTAPRLTQRVVSIKPSVLLIGRS
jgi:hypothetical protein